MKQQNQAINRLAKRMFRANRVRNAFAFLAVLLTTLMLTCVFSIGFSFAKNLNTMELRTRGSISQMTLPRPTQAQLERLRALPYLRAAGIEINIGSFQTDIGSRSVVRAVYWDQTQWEQHILPCVSDVHGRLPQAEDEAMLSSYALSLLGISSPQEGMALSLPFPGAPEKPFRLCGWYTEYGATLDGTALLSEAYCKAHGLTVAQSGSALLSIKPGEEADIVPRLMTDVIPGEGQGFLGGAEESGGSSVLPMVLSVALLAALIALSGYLLIANVLNLSVSQDIRFYGLLKALGTQQRQIARIVRRQSLALAAAIPFGLALGALACFGVVPMAMRAAAGDTGNSAFPAEVSFHPLIFAGAALFALLTVSLSCRKPVRHAGRVPPVEAVRHTPSSPRCSRRIPKRSNGHSRLARMAWRSVFSDRRRAALVFTSMSLGVVLFLSIGSLMEALGGESYFSARYPYDFVCTFRLPSPDPATGEPMGPSLVPTALEEKKKELLERLLQTDGVTQLDTIRSAECAFPFDEAVWEPVLHEAYLTAAQQPAEAATQLPGEVEPEPQESYEHFVQRVKALGDRRLRIYSLGEGYIEQYNHMNVPPLDPEAFRQGESCLICCASHAQMHGRQLTLIGSSGSAQLTIGGSFSWQGTPPPVSQAPSAQTGYLDGIYISEGLLERLDPAPELACICLRVRPEAEPAVKALLNEAASTAGEGAISVLAKSDERAQQQSLIQTMQVLGGGLSILLLLTGLLNFVNVMFTNVLTRRREFAVMESIGLTKRQLFTLLLWEGAIYVLLTGGLSLAVSAGLYALLEHAVTRAIPYAAFSFPLLPALLMAAALTLVCLLTAAVMYRHASRESAAQKLRATQEV